MYFFLFICFVVGSYNLSASVSCLLCRCLVIRAPLKRLAVAHSMILLCVCFLQSVFYHQHRRCRWLAGNMWMETVCEPRTVEPILFTWRGVRRNRSSTCFACFDGYNYTCTKHKSLWFQMPIKFSLASEANATTATFKVLRSSNEWFLCVLVWICTHN